MSQKKSDFLQDLAMDFAAIHNTSVKKAATFKNLYDIVLGAKNALDSGAYEDLTLEEFQDMIKKDLEDIYNNR